MSAEGVELVGAQPSDPAWARLLFVLVEGRDGQWWRGFLLVALTGLVVVGVAGALPAGWVGGLLGVGSLTAGAAALARRRRQTPR